MYCKNYCEVNSVGIYFIVLHEVQEALEVLHSTLQTLNSFGLLQIGASISKGPIRTSKLKSSSLADIDTSCKLEFIHDFYLVFLSVEKHLSSELSA